MFIRLLTFKNKRGGKRQYLQIARSIRHGKKVTQKVIAHLGRIDTPEGRRKLRILAKRILEFIRRAERR